MLIPNHPDDERLSGLAAGDPDEVADAGLSAHVASCVRCTELVNEIGALRMSLADLPDLAPSRPLRLLPPVEEPAPAEGLAGLVRRLFAPALTVGAAMAMVGLVGTASPSGLPTSFEDLGLGRDAAAPQMESADGTSEPASVMDADSDTAGRERTDGDDGYAAEAPGDQQDFAAGESVDRRSGAPGAETAGLPAERSPWPMVLFTGVAVMILAGLLRWILVPRAG
jgi:hypothetical protein